MRILRWVGSAVLGMAAIGLGYLLFVLPRMQEPPSLQIEATPELVAEGRYLVETVMVCTVCHGKRDITLYGQPVVAGTGGAGGHRWNADIGFPGLMVAPNITPHALSDWTDGEIARAVTDGVSRDGRPLFPLMSYTHYRHMCQTDLDRVITYVRSLPAIDSSHPPTRLDFPFNLLVRTFPQPSERPACPDPADQVTRGRYLTEMAGCKTCHTRQENGRPVESMAFAGGFPFPLHQGRGTSVSANITPHATGIGAWTEEAFIARFRAYRNATIHVEPGQPQTEMPWIAFAELRDDDLRALYAFLRTVRPIDNTVTPYVPH